ncbi:MAG: HD domain-containing phosphohydrolase [Thermodesulfovibrionales bacterium]
MKISTRIILSTLVMVSITLFLVTVEYLGMVSLYKDLETVEDLTKEMDAVSNLHFTTQEALLHLSGYLIATDASEKEKFEKAAIKTKEALKSTYFYKDREDSLFGNARELCEYVIKLGENIVKSEVPLNRKDVLMLNVDILRNSVRITHAYEAVHLKNSKKLENTISDAKSKRKKVDTVHKAGVIVLPIVGLLLMLYNIRSIIKPIRRLRDGAVAVSNGNWSYRFDIRDGGEITELSGAIDRMCRTMIGQVDELDGLFRGTVKALSSAIDAKSAWTRGHSERVTSYSLRVGVEMGMSEAELKTLELAGLLHDIGKIGTYETILDKPGRLTEEEIEIIRQHPSKGADIIGHIKQLEDIVPLVRGHHESYNGLGYPDGLKGTEIPIMARILTVCDSYDAMTADRPYRKGRTQEEAVAELTRCAGTQFDPEIVNAFIKVL